MIKAVVSDDPGGRGIRIGGLPLALPADRMPPLRPGTEVIFGIRPEKISGVERAGSASIDVEIVQVEPLGAETIFAGRIANSEKPLFARVGPDIAVAVGERRSLSLDLSAAHVFDADGTALYP